MLISWHTVPDARHIHVLFPLFCDLTIVSSREAIWAFVYPGLNLFGIDRYFAKLCKVRALVRDVLLEQVAPLLKPSHRLRKSLIAFICFELQETEQEWTTCLCRTPDHSAFYIFLLFKCYLAYNIYIYTVVCSIMSYNILQYNIM